MLAAVARGTRATAEALELGAPERTLARRVLRRHEGSWHDGDENLVRGWLDRWDRGGGAPARARAILEAADALPAIGARREALWFLAWAIESVLPAIVDGGGGAD